MARGKGLFELARRGWGQPPQVIARWLVRRAMAALDGRRAPARAAAFDPEKLLSALDAPSLGGLWDRLSGLSYPGVTAPVDIGVYEAVAPGDKDRILAAARDASARRVSLLGSGPVDLPTPIPWQTDFKTGYIWPPDPFNRIDVLTFGFDADVKVPWELSRLQWLVPLGQAYLLTGDDAHAASVRAIILDWIDANPLGVGVNWACTMDVAVRAVTLTWLFHTFKGSPAWSDASFRLSFLTSLYLHGDFIARHLEWTDVNSNHLTSNAAGLVFVGLFFGDGAAPRRWATRGWTILETEITKQVHPDGVDFEASSAYHRLVAELFLLPARYRMTRGLSVGAAYGDRLCRMGHFVAAYTRPDGTAPNWGDADGGRFLPLGGGSLNDHRYLIGLIGQTFDDESLLARMSGPMAEVFWILGSDTPAVDPTPNGGTSRAFPRGGVYVMAGEEDHVFVDCGPVGLGGRGGHGHNDCLSFEAHLAGVPLIADRGAYVYTSSVEDRNRFRGTAFHSTPSVDGAEQNRFVRPDFLWTLHDDARPHVRAWASGASSDIFVGAHGGYQRLATPVTPVRGLVLDKARHTLAVVDRFEGVGNHALAVPYHLAPGVTASEIVPGRWSLDAGGRAFVLAFEGDGWSATVDKTFHAPSYGVREAAEVLVLRHQGALGTLCVGLYPEDQAPDDPAGWLADQETAVRAAADDTATPIRILINAVHAKSGGGVTYLENILPHLARTPGVDLHLAIEDGQQEKFTDVLAGVTVHALPPGGRQWGLPWREQIAVPKLARRIRPDVTFSLANYGPVFVPGAVVLIQNAPSVIAHERRPGLIAYWVALYIMTLVSLVFCRRAIAISGYVAGLFTRVLPRRVSEKIAVVPFGVSAVFAPGGAGREDFLLAVSDIYAQKNYETLLAAFAKVRKAHPGINLKIAGRVLDGAYRERLGDVLRRKGLDGHVDFLGHVPTHDLAELYRRCAVFVFPSLVESFGHPLLEAMASGAPVACSDRAAMPEVVGEAGLYFDPTNADNMADVIVRLLGDGALRQALGEKGIARAGGHDWAKTATETLAVLRAAAGMDR